MRDTRERLEEGYASDGRRVRRPVAGPLQTYRVQITSGMSIWHRFTGMGLGVGVLLLVSWLVALASGPTAFAAVQGFTSSIVGMILLFLWTVAFMFHMCNGIRHLAWDNGVGFGSWTSPLVSQGRTVYHRSGWTVIVLSLVLTAAVWIAVAVIVA